MNKDSVRICLLGLLCMCGVPGMAPPPSTSDAPSSSRALAETQREAPESPNPLAHTQSAFRVITVSVPTYPFEAFLQSAHDDTYDIDYPVLDWDAYRSTNPSPAPKDYALLVLENDSLRASFLPELGGRVYELISKHTGNNELYRNPVIKPTHWGPPEQGWWLAAGGIEWCLPVAEHGYEWGQPWSWSVISSTAGVTLTLQDTHRADRIRATIEVWLPTDSAYLAVRPRIENPTSTEIDLSFWENAMIAPGAPNSVQSDTHLILGTTEAAVHSTGDDRLPGTWPTIPSSPGYRFSWPEYSGVDFSRLGNWHEWIGFFEFPRAASNFTAVYDTSADEGIIRVFPPNIARGSKAFGRGWSTPIDSHTWTDDGSAYVELHGGPAPTYWEQTTLSPGGSLSWTEYWYPASGIGWVSSATREAALSVRAADHEIQISVFSTRSRPSGTADLYAWDRANCSQLAHYQIPAVGPGSPFRGFVHSAEVPTSRLAVAFTDREGGLLAGYNLKDCMPPTASVKPLPPYVSTSTFTVTWSGRDSLGSVADYDIQVRDGVEGQWADWITRTPSMSAQFGGQDGHTYFFRARAHDLSGNTGPFGGPERGDAFTTILMSPAPVLVTSTKQPGRRVFPPGQPVSYSIVLSNTGNLTAGTNVTDILPAGMRLLTETLTCTAMVPTYVRWTHTIRWSGAIPPGQTALLTYGLTPTAGLAMGALQTNVVSISGSVLGSFSRSTVVRMMLLTRLPIVMRDWYR
jgi:uncharacterized repeat protein (TIGR01451 family)